MPADKTHNTSSHDAEPDTEQSIPLVGSAAPDFTLSTNATSLSTSRTCGASKSSSTSIPRTTRPAAPPRRAASATPGTI